MLLLLAPFIMLLPTALATNEIVPSNLRAIGLIPFVFYLPGAGIDDVYVGDLGNQFKRDSADDNCRADHVGILALIVGWIWPRSGSTFGCGGAETAVYYETDGDLTAVAPFLDQLDTDWEKYLRFGAALSTPYAGFSERKVWAGKMVAGKPGGCVPRPRGTRSTFFPTTARCPAGPSDYFSPGRAAAQHLCPRRQPGVSGLRANCTGHQSRQASRSSVNFGNAITLLGVRCWRQVTAGETLPLFLYWEVGLDQTADFTPFIHFEDSWGQRWSQVETFAYPAAQWSRGETIVQRVEVPVPVGTPLGSYQLRVGLFSGSSGERLPRLEANGRYAGDTYLIENVTVLPGEPTPLFTLNRQPPIKLHQQVRPQLGTAGGRARVP